MSIRFEKVGKEFPKLDMLDELNREAFPDSERIEVERQIALMEAGKTVFVAAYEEDTFVGFLVYVPGPKEEVLFPLFLAVARDKRSEGYGGRILKHLEDLYPESTLVLEMEELKRPTIRREKGAKDFIREMDFMIPDTAPPILAWSLP